MARLRWRRDVYDPLEEFDRLREEFGDLFDLPREPTVRGLFDRPVSPAIDVVEEAERFSVICDLPGMKRDDIEVSLAQGVLTIKGEKKLPKRPAGAPVYRGDTWEGKFQRTVALPSNVDPASVKADLRDGVLTVALPKREEAKPKQITIQTR
jgi:HSP20 family protein